MKVSKDQDCINRQYKITEILSQAACEVIDSKIGYSIKDS